MASARNLPLLLAGVAIVGATAWILMNPTDSNEVARAEPEAESDTASASEASLESGPQPATYVEPEPEPEPAPEPEPEPEPEPQEQEVFAPAGNGGSSAEFTLPAATPPPPTAATETIRSWEERQAEAIQRAIDSSTDAWTERLQLDKATSDGLRDALTNNAQRQSELKDFAEGGANREDVQKRATENLKKLNEELKSVLSTSQFEEYVRLSGASADS